MKIAVVGAGIGGLAVAGGLHRAGAGVTVLERSPGLRVAGAGISLFGNGFTALRSLGLADQVRARAVCGPAIRGGQRRPDGRWLLTTPPDSLTEWGIVHRADLHDVLMTGLAPGTVRWGAEVRAVSAAGDEVTWQSDGVRVTEQFDVVVAADGINSAVRRSWPGDPGIRYAGYAAWRGITDRPVELNGAAGETWGRGLRFGVAPLADGRVYWFAVMSMPPRTVIDDEYATVQRLFGGWHAPIGEIIGATTATNVFRLDINELAGPLPSFRRGRCVLIGDAAHAMTPDLGQGGGQALEDAATLVRLLRAGNVDQALAAYDRMRRPRTRAVARQARLVGRVAQARNPVLAGIRDVVVRVLPAAAVARPLRAIQSWQPPASDLVTANR